EEGSAERRGKPAPEARPPQAGARLEGGAGHSAAAYAAAALQDSARPGLGRCPPQSSEDAFTDDDQVVRLDRIVQLRLEDLDVALADAAMQTHATVRAAQGEAAALGDRLRDGHAAVQGILPGTLDLP